MATQTDTATATETTLTLDPPQPLQTVQPEQAAGLVPLEGGAEERSSRRRSTRSSPSWSRSIPTRPNSARRSTS